MSNPDNMDPNNPDSIKEQYLEVVENILKDIYGVDEDFGAEYAEQFVKNFMAFDFGIHPCTEGMKLIIDSFNFKSQASLDALKYFFEEKLKKPLADDIAKALIESDSLVICTFEIADKTNARMLFIRSLDLTLDLAEIVLDYEGNEFPDEQTQILDNDIDET